MDHGLIEPLILDQNLVANTTIMTIKPPTAKDFKRFPFLTKEAIEQLQRLPDLYKEWNSRINVISRKDMELLWERHIFHSLTLGLAADFHPRLGYGRWFPGHSSGYCSSQRTMDTERLHGEKDPCGSSSF